MYYHFHIIHHFFRKKEINHIYISIFLMTLAVSLISLFVPIYFYSLNYPITTIIFFYFLTSFFFVVFSTLGAKIFSKIGIKYSMLISTPFTICYFLGLNFIQEAELLFFMLPLFHALGMIFFNYGFHMNYIEHSDKKKEGLEVSFIGILITIATVLGPLVAGFIIGIFSYNVLFILGSSILILGTIPLFFIKERYKEVSINFNLVKSYLFNRKHARNIASFMGYAIESIIGMTVWPVFLIILLLTTETVGLLVSISFIISIITFYFVGILTDKFKDRMKLIRIGTILYFFGWLGRLFVNSPLRFLIFDSYKNVTEKILNVPWSVASYDIARKEQYFVFIVMREITYNLIRIIILPFIIFIFYVGFHPFKISFIIAALFALLYPLLKKVKS